MIKLNAMRIPVLIALLFGWLLLSPQIQVKSQSNSSEPQVISPRAGEALQGMVEISGITAIENFARTEVEFRFTNDPKDTWFLVAETDQAVNPGKIADWDTTSVTDGNYDMRVTVVMKNGESKSVLIPGIRIRNYSLIESPTAPAINSGEKDEDQTATPQPTRTPRPTPLPLPSNPAVLTNADLNSSLVRGASAGIGFFLAFAIYWVVKKSLS